ncbi:MAG: sulfate ABC transporter permease subunit CysT [Thermoleophilia bacterium]|nr:sulfate ABC transporter permease subunit CysT [Thermoleophilia bacterium]
MSSSTTRPARSPRSKRSWEFQLKAESTQVGVPPSRAGIRLPGTGEALSRGLVLTYLSLIVLIPLAAIASKAFSDGWGTFWESITSPQAVAALELTVTCSLIVVAINAVMGTLIAWVLVRDEFPGKVIVNSVIDLPFALPTIVASLTLLTLYGTDSPLGIHASYTRVAVIIALLFVTLPFVVRAVQPLLLSLDRDMESAAESLGAGRGRIFWRIVFPNLAPGIAAGVALAFARALGEFGAVILISGNVPFKTEVASVFIRGQIESDNVVGAASVSVVLLAISLVLLAFVNTIQKWGLRYDR